MDTIFWLDDPQKLAILEEILSSLTPNRKSKEEFETEIKKLYGDSCFCQKENGVEFMNNEEMVRINYLPEGSISVLARLKDSNAWYIPEIKWDLVLLYGISADELADKNSLGFMQYKMALIAKLVEKNSD